MSDKTERNIDVVRQEYSQLCAQAGNLQYQIVTLQKDLGILNEQLTNLNLEAAKLQAAEKEKKANE